MQSFGEMRKVDYKDAQDIGSPGSYYWHARQWVIVSQLSTTFGCV